MMDYFEEAFGSRQSVVELSDARKADLILSSDIVHLRTLQSIIKVLSFS